MSQDDVQLLLLKDAEPYQSTCGYCSPPGQRSGEKTSYDRGLRVGGLPCAAYQELIDCGWRRSGKYMYKPDMRASCCPPYTIKLDALQFAPSKSMRKIVNQWNKYIHHGGNDHKKPASSSPTQRSVGSFDIVAAMHASEAAFSPNEQFAHPFEVALEPSQYSEEKFELFCKYQEAVHNDHHSSPRGFKRFLVETPLYEEPIEYGQNGTYPPHLPASFGSYHMTYRLDGELFAFSVIDVLPACVSSVYFVYRPGLEQFSLGKLSVMREAALAKEMHDAGASAVQSLYLGYYIHSCAKMRYKGAYAPSYLLDPESYEWYPLETWLPLLDKYHYASIARSERNITHRPVPGQPEEADDAAVPAELNT